MIKFKMTKLEFIGGVLMTPENNNAQNSTNPNAQKNAGSSSKENNTETVDVNHNVDFTDPKYYQNREVSWLAFNKRVIAEAEDPHNPLAEQINFLSIGSSNLDEFIQVRVAGLQDQVNLAGNYKDSKKQWSAEKQLEEVSKANTENVKYQYDLYDQKIAELADTFNFNHKKIEDLNAEQVKQINAYFESHIQPAITPFGIDAYRPFPNLENGAIHIFVRLLRDGDPFVAIIPVPKLLKRYHLIDDGDGKALVFIEDIITYHMESLFKGFEIDYSFIFRIMRNADLELQEEGAEDLLSVIENYLEVRKNGTAVRIEIDTRKASERLVNDVAFLINELELSEQDIYSINGPLDLTYLSDVRDDILEEYPDKGYKPFTPHYPAYLKNQSIFDAIDERDVMLHHPYDSFEPVLDLIAQAANDSNTVAIKQTLYRVSSTSPLIASLKRAAKRGIQVTVLVELKARFDEENNVHWAKELEDSGIHVLYGMKELKTHSKATLVVKQAPGGFKRYVHLGTGNYNEKTAKGYTDFSYMTARQGIVEDVAAFFNYLSGYSERPNYNHLHVSPNELRNTFIDKIDEEIENHRENGNGHIIAKMNSLTDKEYIMKLFQASNAGVKIELIIRGICCLVPGIKGVSENITVRSIVGRLLEHSRVYYFANNGNPKVYLSSADMMTRNLSRRVEIAFPVQDDGYKQEIIDFLNLSLADNYKAWELQNDNTYEKQQPAKGEELISLQETLLKKTGERKQKQRVVEKKNWFERLADKLLSN